MLQRFFSTLAATLQRRLPGTTVQDKVLPTDCGFRFRRPIDVLVTRGVHCVMRQSRPHDIRQTIG